MPKLPDRKPRTKSKSSQRKSRRPFTCMAVSGLGLGLTYSEMNRMKYTHLVQLLWEADEASGTEYVETRDATMDDLRMMMNM